MTVAERPVARNLRPKPCVRCGKGPRVVLDEGPAYLCAECLNTRAMRDEAKAALKADPRNPRHHLLTHTWPSLGDRPWHGGWGRNEVRLPRPQSRTEYERDRPKRRLAVLVARLRARMRRQNEAGQPAS